MEGNFVRVYGLTADRRRYEFLYIYNSRLKVAPLALAGFFVVNPDTKEFHSYIFTESYRREIQRESYSFVNHASDYEHFSSEAKLSADRFYSLLHTLRLDDFDFKFIDCLF